MTAKTNKCVRCSHKQSLHDLALSEYDTIGKHCLSKNCLCKGFMTSKQLKAMIK